MYRYCFLIYHLILVYYCYLNHVGICFSHHQEGCCFLTLESLPRKVNSSYLAFSFKKFVV